MESRCKQESQQREQRSERSERHRHTTTHLEPSCKHLGPSCKHLQCKGSAKAAWWTHLEPSCKRLQCKAHGSFCANLEPSCKSAKLMDHSVPTWSPPASPRLPATRLHARNRTPSPSRTPGGVLVAVPVPRNTSPRTRTRKRCAGTLEHFFVTATRWPAAYVNNEVKDLSFKFEFITSCASG